MTVSELRDLLYDYPDEMEVVVPIESSLYVRPLRLVDLEEEDGKLLIGG